MSRVSVKESERNGEYRVTATRGEYLLQIRYQPSDRPIVPPKDYVVCADGTRNGVYGWHQIGRIGADSAAALAVALRSGELADLRDIAP